MKQTNELLVVGTAVVWPIGSGRLRQKEFDFELVVDIDRVQNTCTLLNNKNDLITYNMSLLQTYVRSNVANIL